MRIAAFFALTFACACASTPPRTEYETVTPAGGGRFWVAGSQGLTDYYDGQRYVSRQYPLNPKIDRDLYEPSAYVPVAQVVTTAGGDLLFTRVGDVFRWSGSKW